jgi:actin beta/gamma 1
MIDGTGNLVDSELFSWFFHWTERACLNVDAAEHPAPVTQPTHLSRQPESFDRWRMSLCETLFEFACHPGVCLEYHSDLSCCVHEAHTALVLDFGRSCLRVVPVIEGKSLVSNDWTRPFTAWRQALSPVCLSREEITGHNFSKYVLAAGNRIKAEDSAPN